MRRTILASVSVLVLCGVVSGYELEVSWIPGEFSPDFSISPEEPTTTDLIHFTVPTELFESRRDAEWGLGGTPQLSIDPDTRTIRLRFQGEPSAPISEFYNPVCGLRGYFGPLERGTWLFDVFFQGTIWRVNINVNPPDPNIGGVKAEYFSGMSPIGDPLVVGVEEVIDHQWDDGEIVYDLFDQVSARWTADLKITDADMYTFVTNSDDGVRLWLDGERIINNWTDHGPTFDTSAPIYLEPGLYSLQMEWFENSGGAVAQLFWQTPDRQRSIIPADALQLPVSAGSPYPHDGAFNVSQSLTLSWTAGDGAVRHSVYFGENFNAVNTGTGGTFRGNQDSTFFVVGFIGFPYPNGLVPDTTYYWRVDEVQADGTTRKGKVWRFTTAVFSVDEDFEGFKDEDGWRISDTWIREGGATGPYTDQTIVFSGEQSMLFEYNNRAENVDYSEAKRTFDPPQDWTDEEALILFVYGRTDNVADTLYIWIEDSIGRTARVENPDPDVLRSDEWTPWRIPLIEFEFANTGINLNMVKTMSIGVGEPGPSQPPVPDGLNDDCANAIHIGNVMNLPFDTTNATFDGPGHCTTAPNIWYVYTATQSGGLTISLCGSSYDTTLAVYDGSDCPPKLEDMLRCNDDFCGRQSEVEFAVTAGNQYLIEIGGFGSITGQGVMNISYEMVPEGRPSNDDCDDAMSVGNVTNLRFDTTYATFDGPGYCMDSPNIWYTYYADHTDSVTVSLCGSSYDSKLAVYNRVNCPPSQSDLIECNDDFCGTNAQITFTAFAGSHYLIEVGAYNGETGQGVLNISSEGALNSPLLRDGPKLFANSDGEEGEFNVDSVITAGPGFRTLMGTVSSSSNNRPISGATVTLTGGFKNLLPTGSDGFYAVCLVNAMTNYNADVTAPPNLSASSSVNFGDNWVKTRHFEVP